MDLPASWSHPNLPQLQEVGTVLLKWVIFKGQGPKNRRTIAIKYSVLHSYDWQLFILANIHTHAYIQEHAHITKTYILGLCYCLHMTLSFSLLSLSM